MRVLPLENEAVNECWLSDRDRFSYEALNSRRAADRADDQAGRRVARGRLAHRARLRRARPDADHASSTAPQRDRRAGVAACARVEELHLLASADARPRLRQRRLPPAPGRLPRDAAAAGVPLARHADRRAVEPLDACWSSARSCARTIRCFAQRLRAGGARSGAQVIERCTRVRRRLADAGGAHEPRRRAERLAAGAGRHRWPRSARPRASRRRPAPGDRADDAAQAIAAALLAASARRVLLGNAAVQHPAGGAARTRSRRDRRADRRDASAVLGEAANSVGAQLVGALPRRGRPRRAARCSARRRCKAYLLLQRRARARLRRSGRRRAPRWRQAELVVALTAVPAGTGDDYADVLLPIAPFTETAGTFVNCEGRVQSFNGVVKPLGEARPAWKVLRVLGNLLGLPASTSTASDEVRAEALGDVDRDPGAPGGRRQRRRAGAHALPPPATPARSSASPTCRSTSPIRWCAAPRALQLTADARAAGRRRAERRWPRARHRRRRPRSASRRAAGVGGPAGARSTRAGRERGPRRRRRIRSPRRSARCSAASRSRSSRWPERRRVAASDASAGSRMTTRSPPSAPRPSARAWPASGR